MSKHRNLTLSTHHFWKSGRVELTVDFWGPEGKGLGHHYLVFHEPLDVPEGDRENPIALLRAAYALITEKLAGLPSERSPRSETAVGPTGSTG